MLHAGLDLSRRKVDVCLLSTEGEIVDEWASPPDTDGLRGLAARAAMGGRPSAAWSSRWTARGSSTIELEEHGWEVLIADAQKVKGLAPLACKTDKIDARVLAALSARDLVPQIWLPDPSIRREREHARFRLHLVRHRTTLKNRIHAALIALGHPCPVSDLFGHAGRELLDRLPTPHGPLLVARSGSANGATARPWRSASQLQRAGPRLNFVGMQAAVVAAEALLGRGGRAQARHPAGGRQDAHVGEPRAQPRTRVAERAGRDQFRDGTHLGAGAPQRRNSREPGPCRWPTASMRSQ
jgi:transposase